MGLRSAQPVPKWANEQTKLFACMRTNTFLLGRAESFVRYCCHSGALYKGGYDAADIMGWYAQRFASHLWGAPPALYHLFLLSAIASAEFCQGPTASSRRSNRRANAFDSWWSAMWSCRSIFIC